MTSSAVAPRRDMRAEHVLTALFLAASVVVLVDLYVAPFCSMALQACWAIAIGTAAARAFWRMGDRAPQRVVLPAAVWFGALAAGWLRDGRPGAWATSCEALAAATGTAAVIAALRPTRATVMAVVVLALCTVVVRAQNPGTPAIPLLRRIDAVRGAGALLTVNLVVRRREALAVCALGVTALVDLALRAEGDGLAVPWIGSRTVELCLGAVVLVHVLADLPRTRTALRGDAASARITAWIQLHPWITSVVAAAVISGVAGPWIWEWQGRSVFWQLGDSARMGLVVAALGFLCHAAHATKGVDRLAPWLAAGIAAVALSASVAQEAASWITPATGPADEQAWIAPVVAFAPALLNLLYDRVRLDAPTRVATALRLAAVGVLVWRLWRNGSDEQLNSAAGGAWAVVAALAFHAAVASRLPGDRALLVCGLLASLEYYGSARFLWFGTSHQRYFGKDGDVIVSILAKYGAWLLAGLLVGAARRVRSMTVVPDDHPVAELNSVRVPSAG